MKVYIDGENLRQRLVAVLHQENRVQGRDDMFRLDVRALVTAALGESPDEIFYYTTKIKQPEFEIPEKLRHKIGLIQESHRRWIAELTNQGVTVIKAGLLKVHESQTCYACGKRTMLLHEKGVDVRLAIDIVQAAIGHNTDHIVLLSSDSDMIPAIEVARRSGVKVTYLCSVDEKNQAVALSTDDTLGYTEEHILNAYNGNYDQAQH